MAQPRSAATPGKRYRLGSHTRLNRGGDGSALNAIGIESVAPRQDDRVDEWRWREGRTVEVDASAVVGVRDDQTLDLDAADVPGRPVTNEVFGLLEVRERLEGVERRRFTQQAHHLELGKMAEQFALAGRGRDEWCGESRRRQRQRSHRRRLCAT